MNDLFLLSFKHRKLVKFIIFEGHNKYFYKWPKTKEFLMLHAAQVNRMKIIGSNENVAISYFVIT